MDLKSMPHTFRWCLNKPWSWRNYKSYQTVTIEKTCCDYDSILLSDVETNSGYVRKNSEPGVIMIRIHFQWCSDKFWTCCNYDSNLFGDVQKIRFKPDASTIRTYPEMRLRIESIQCGENSSNILVIWQRFELFW